MKKFDIMFCGLGNGLTVCNRASMENGDYKNICHISPAGNITWYVNPGQIPGDDLLRIEHNAHAMEANFRAQLDAMPEIKQYGYLLDRAPASVLLKCLDMKAAALSEKVAYLKSALLPIL